MSSFGKDGRATPPGTLQEILGSTSDVSMFWEHLLDSRITAINTSKCAAAGECITVLAPNNAAWSQRAASLSWSTLSIEEKQKIIFGQYLESPKTGSIPTKLSTLNWQLAGESLPLIDVGFGKGALYNEIVGPRYAFSVTETPGVYYINDAKVITKDLDASNGMIQIMDKVVNYPYESMDFYQYLSQAQELTWTEGSGSRAIKFYVGFPQDPLPTAVNTGSLTPGEMAGSGEGAPVTITVKGSYAQTAGPAVALRNAVLIPVTAPIGYLHETTQDALARLSPSYVKTGILDKQIKGGPYTYFASDNKAFDDMEADTNVGVKLLKDPDRLTYVLRRMIFPLQILLNELNVTLKYDVATANNAFTLEYVRFDLQAETGVNSAIVNGTINVSMFNGGYQCTDGWIYSVDKVFYVQADLERSLCTMPACLSSTTTE
ncbi:unnamed protein product [Mesocestoides corti]|uniref:FAS1 domain-containing protein n=1 Tax=Mesocestoides corti TaxID=53468 RepID=A0A0R3UGP9_MESCO|nr:unnamed protein product [Mesocestoides corti]